jgi:hypothetical protein
MTGMSLLLSTAMLMCVKDVYTFRIGNSFCIEEQRICCTMTTCQELRATACYPNKLFVGDFEESLPLPKKKETK